jgi:16S rRNA (cytosine967-C5)-methyltransferase
VPAKNFHVRQAAVSALRAWAKGHDYAETLVDRHAQRRMLSAPDRALLQAILFGVLRHRRVLDAWIGKLRKGKLDADTRDILRVGLCQILILNIPDHAAVNETVEAGKTSVRPLINAVLRKAISERKELLEQLDEMSPAVLHSHPDWLFKRWGKAFGKPKAIAIMEWDNQPAETFFRLNPLAPTDAEIPGTPLDHAPGYFKLEGKIPSRLLAEGSLYIQDPATRHCVEMLDPKPGERILDACAAPGGKAFLIASTMGGGKGLVCTDSNEKRIPRLEENLGRLGIEADEVSTHDWRKPAPERFHQAFDAILLDVPCSNTGVIRRRVDVRWRLQAPEIENLIDIQREILRNALPCLKPGGRIVYSTCSIEDSENIDLVTEFAEEHGLRLEKSIQITPVEHGTDGAFAARLSRPLFHLANPPRTCKLRHMKSTLLLALTVIVLVVALGSVVGLMHLAKTSEVSRVTESAQ